MVGVIEITSLKEYNRYIKGPGVTVVDFSAVWCGPCRYISPYYSDLSKEYRHVSFLKVDVDACQDVAAVEAVRSMPTFKIYAGGAQVESFSGADVAQLKSAVARHAGSSSSGPGHRLGGTGPSSSSSSPSVSAPASVIRPGHNYTRELLGLLMVVLLLVWLGSQQRQPSARPP